MVGIQYSGLVSYFPLPQVSHFSFFRGSYFPKYVGVGHFKDRENEFKIILFDYAIFNSRFEHEEVEISTWLIWEELLAIFRAFFGVVKIENPSCRTKVSKNLSFLRKSLIRNLIHLVQGLYTPNFPYLEKLPARENKTEPFFLISEFISGSINLGKQTEKQNMFIKTEFHKTANSEDGYVKKKVISKIFKETVQDKMSKKQINYFMDRIDQDGNGWIDYNGKWLSFLCRICFKFHFLEFVDFFFELAKTAANDAIQPPKDKTKDKRKSFFRIRWFLLWIGPFGNGKIGIINHDISLKYIFKNIQLDPHEFCLLDDYVVR